MLVMKNIEDDYFVKKYIPTLMINRAVSLLNDKRVKLMDDYLKENYKVGIKEVLEQIINNYEINFIDGNVVFRLNNNTLETNSQIKLASLVRLIDDGTVDIKGTKVLTKVKNFIRDNARDICLAYFNRKG